MCGRARSASCCGCWGEPGLRSQVPGQAVPGAGRGCQPLGPQPLVGSAEPGVGGWACPLPARHGVLSLTPVCSPCRLGRVPGALPPGRARLQRGQDPCPPGTADGALGSASEQLHRGLPPAVFPEALSLQGTARFSWAGGCSQPAAAWALPTLYCTPEETGTVPSHTAALYVQLLFALRERALRALEAGLVSELYDALGVLRVGWEGLAQDLASGRLSPHLELPEGTRPRAAELRAECARGWDGVARRLWPRLQVVVVVAEPSSEQIYGEALREQECQGLPFYCPFYSAAGALLGVNLWPEQPDSRYLLCPGWAFCEFLPAGPGAEAPPETVLLADMQEGQEYELVLTDQAGLSRCRVGEVLKVAEFHNQCPVVRPVRRLSQTLSVRGEGVPEERFYGSLRRAVAMWPGARLVDYICAESSLLGASSGVCAPHYQVFVELRGLRDLSEAQRYKVSGLGKQWHGAGLSRGSWCHGQVGVFLPLPLEGFGRWSPSPSSLQEGAILPARDCSQHGALAPKAPHRCPHLAWGFPPGRSVLPWLGLATRWQHSLIRCPGRLAAELDMDMERLQLRC
uniref:GH3 domain containing n=1 Tax=Gopherus evgoodei TaxID=1825980 RepID=A0A8C4W8J9_9SAUR